jgi:hypothetical protein
MRALEAKDFLVQQTAEQAALENVPLSDLEKRMMYFTETDECPEDPIALNDAFEAAYDPDEYEAKVSKLMHHAYQRVRKENSEALRRWKEAMAELSKGDHYLLVLCEDGTPRRPLLEGSPPVSLESVGTVILWAVLLIGIFFALPAIFGRYGFHWRGHQPPLTRELVPLWAQRSLIALMIGAYVYWGVLPLISNRLRVPFPLLLSKIFGKRQRNNAGK